MFHSFFSAVGAFVLFVLTALPGVAAIGDVDNFIINNDQFFGGMTEVIAQNANAFNAASQGAIRLVSARHRGNHQEESFIQRISGLVSRRDNTVTTAATILPMTMDEEVRVKLNRKIGPVSQTIDSWKKVDANPDRMSFILGQQTAQAVLVDHVDSALIAVEAALDGIVALEHDRSAGTIRTEDLIDGLSKRGDKAGEIVAWVMHSKPYFDLVKDQIADAVYRANGTQIVNGIPATVNRPVIITDSPGLIQAGSPTNYVTLGLVAGAVTVSESEERTIWDERKTGAENLYVQIQGEYAITVGVHGFKFATGTSNPTDAALGNSGNWTQTGYSHKTLAGVRIQSQ